MPDIFEHQSTPQVETTNPTFETVERIEYGDGIRMVLTGHPFPFHGVPSIEAVQAINVVKKFLMLQPLRAAELAILPYTLKPEYMHHAARELRRIFTGRLGQLLAQVIEYDSAYRFRLLDLFSETTQKALSQKPIREILRLIEINKHRDYPDAHQKVKKAAYLLILGLLWPPSNKYFRESIKRSDFSALQPDEADTYWLRKRTDYHAQPPTRG